MRAACYDVAQSLRETSRELPHRLQSCVDHTPVPVVEVRSSGPAVGLLPEVSQQILERPCSALTKNFAKTKQLVSSSLGGLSLSRTGVSVQAPWRNLLMLRLADMPMAC